MGVPAFDVCLPFVLFDSDEGTPRRLASVPVVLPQDYAVTALVRLATPAQLRAALASGDRVEGWATLTESVLLAAVERLAVQADRIQAAASTDPDTFVWWEQCRAHLHWLFQPPTTPTTSDDTAREA